MTYAIWNGRLIAQSDDTVVVEGNHYFPPNSIDWDLLSPNGRQTTSPWKGVASYYDITVDGRTNRAAAWQYESPKPAAARTPTRSSSVEWMPWMPCWSRSIRGTSTAPHARDSPLRGSTGTVVPTRSTSGLPSLRHGPWSSWPTSCAE